MEIDSNVRVCKICFEEETDKNKLISPCKCRGTSKWVHQYCLEAWLSQQTSNQKCEICLYHYRIVEQISLIRSFLLKCKQNYKVFKVCWVFIPVLLGTVYVFVALLEHKYAVLERNVVLYFCLFVLIGIIFMCLFSVAVDVAVQVVRTPVRNIKVFSINEDTENISSSTIHT